MHAEDIGLNLWHLQVGLANPHQKPWRITTCQHRQFLEKWTNGLTQRLSNRGVATPQPKKLRTCPLKGQGGWKTAT